jgi:hypothetical protein
MKQQRQAATTDFRLIRTFDMDHNIRRLKACCKRLESTSKHRKLAALMRMKRRAKGVRTAR